MLSVYTKFDGESNDGCSLIFLCLVMCSTPFGMFTIPLRLKIDFMLQNFLFTSKDENSTLKAIDFGLSDYVKPGQVKPITYLNHFFFSKFLLERDMLRVV